MPFIKRTARPDMPSFLGPTVRNELAIGRGYDPNMLPDEAMRFLNSLDQASSNITKASTLYTLGGDPEKAMEPAARPETSPSVMQHIFNALDNAMGAPAIRYGIAKAQGAPLYNKSILGGNGKSKVGWSDIIRYVQDTALGGSTNSPGQRWARGAGGFAGDVLTDPMTYTSFGLGSGPKIGAKVLSKEGVNIYKKMAPAFNKATDKKAAMEVISQALEAAASKGEKVYNSPATRLFGQKIGPDPFSALGKGIKSGYSTLKEFSNPVNAKTVGLTRKLAGGLVSGIEDIGAAVSTKFGLEPEYLSARQGFENHINNASLDIKDGLQSIFTKKNGKVANEKELVTILRHIDDPKHFSIAPDLQKVTDDVRSKFAELLKRGQDKGVLGAARTDYIARRIGKDSIIPRWMRGEKEGGRLSTSVGGAKKERHYPTISDLFKAQPGLESITNQNAATALGKYWASLERSIATKDFLDKVKGLSQTVRVGEKGLRTPHQERLASGLTDFKHDSGIITDLPRKVVEDLHRVDNPKYVSGWGPLGAAYRAGHNAWKSMVTIVNPAFHARNGVSNQVLSALDVGKEMLNKNLYVDVAKIMAGGKGKIANRYGYEYTYDEIRQLMRENNVIKAGWGRNEGNVKSGLQRAISISHPIEAMSRVGGVVENEGRITNFLAHLYKGDTPEVAAQGVAHALFDYSDITNMDRAIKWVIPFWCVPVSHEILTREGWKYESDLKIGEDVLTYKLETGELEWGPVEEKAVFDFDGLLKKFDTKQSDWLFTDDHRWPTINITTQSRSGAHYGGERRMKRTHELNTADLIPRTGDYKETESILSPRHAAILGWVITDGYWRVRDWSPNSCEMMVYQSPKKHLQEIITLLGTKPRTPHPITGVVCVPVALADIKIIREYFGSNADLPFIVGRLSIEAARAMWDAMYKAEGSTSYRANGDIHQRAFVQDVLLHGPIMEAFQILTILVGKWGNIRRRKDRPNACIGALSVSNWKFIRCKEGLIDVPYTGKIWCPKTPNGTWVMRYNGVVCITGNTFSRKSAELTARTLITNPGRITGELRLAKNIGGALFGGQEVSQEDLKALPEFYKEGLTIAHVGKDNAIEILSGLGLPIEDLENYPVFSGTQRFASKALFGRMTPMLKYPMEIYHNRDYFFGAPLDPTSSIKNPDGTVSRAYSKSYPMLEGLPEAAKAWLEYKKLPDKDGQPRYTINSLKLKQFEYFVLGVASVIPSLGTPFIFSRYYRDVGKLTDTSKPLAPRILDAFTGIRTYELPGAGTLRTRAAQKQTSQINNLLTDAIYKKKQETGMP
mgnify:CR=1 FL=1